MTYYISKQFETSTAHRVDCQVLCDIMRENTLRKKVCRNLHGHNYTFSIGLASENLVNEMVLDFSHFGSIKKALDLYVDHKTLIRKDDPMKLFLVDHCWSHVRETIPWLASQPTGENRIEYVQKLMPSKPVYQEIEELDGGEGYKCYKLVIDNAIREMAEDSYLAALIDCLDSFTITDFATTSENFAKWMFNVAKNTLAKTAAETTDSYLKDVIANIKVQDASCKESVKSIATYSE